MSGQCFYMVRSESILHPGDVGLVIEEVGVLNYGGHQALLDFGDERVWIWGYDIVGRITTIEEEGFALVYLSGTYLGKTEVPVDLDLARRIARSCRWQEE